MSDDIYNADALMVSRYCGPARDDDRARVRFQFCIGADGYPQLATLSADETRELVTALDLELRRFNT